MEEAQQEYKYKPRHRRPRTWEERYFNDPRWKTAKELSSQSRYAECAALVTRIMRSYGKIYS